MKLQDFKHGMRVRYVPYHAHGNVTHKDCQDGVVSSVGQRFVFVKYDCAACVMTTGNEPYTSQATAPEDLVSRSFNEEDAK